MILLMASMQWSPHWHVSCFSYMYVINSQIKQYWSSFPYWQGWVSSYMLRLLHSYMHSESFEILSAPIISRSLVFYLLCSGFCLGLLSSLFLKEDLLMTPFNLCFKSDWKSFDLWNNEVYFEKSIWKLYLKAPHADLWNN